MARTDRVGEIAGGAPRSSGRGRTGASTTGTGTPKPKVEKAPTMKQKMASAERALTSPTGKDPKLNKTAGKNREEKIKSRIGYTTKATKNKDLAKVVNRSNGPKSDKGFNERVIAKANKIFRDEKALQKKSNGTFGDTVQQRKETLKKGFGATPKLPVKKSGKK